jgi:hypothetical protein
VPADKIVESGKILYSANRILLESGIHAVEVDRKILGRY